MLFTKFERETQEMLLTIYLLLILCGVFIKESKVYNFLTVSFLGFITLDNYSAADYASLYLPTYLNPSFDSKSWRWLDIFMLLRKFYTFILQQFCSYSMHALCGMFNFGFKQVTY